MLAISDTLKEKIEFNKVIEAIQSYCLSVMSRQKFDSLSCSVHSRDIEESLRHAEEYKHLLSRGEVVPVSRFETIIQDVYMLRKEGYVLDLEAIQRIFIQLSIVHSLEAYFSDIEKSKAAPLTRNLVFSVYVDPAILAEIDRILDKDGEVRPDASPELLKISKTIKSREREADKLFFQELEFYKSKGFLSENGESLRSGRKVLTVAVEHKRKIPGIILDESATGKTVFMEPEKLMVINQEIHNLYAERKAEIYKIIRNLCQFLHPFADTLEAVEDMLVRLDMLQAKAKFALSINASRPNITNTPAVKILQGRHPVLQMKFMQTGQKVIPFDLTLDDHHRILILSGPNAGGKSVVMKSVGLLQLMVQAGILVPVHENSVFGIFHKLFLDIGDQQSLEDDLSTYSSHLKHMKLMTEEADQHAMVLIDEFGSGTDPKMGGAIAESVLYQINARKAFGVITTHYGNLKFFAFKVRGLINGSMEFDKQKLSPTYNLQVGKPGSSFAFEIAAKIGLSEQIIHYAKKNAGQHEQAVDQMLVSLMEEKKEYERKFESLIEKQDKLDKLIRNYEQMMADLEVRKKKIKLQSKEVEQVGLYSQQQEVQKLIREIRKTKDEEKARVLAESLRKQQEEEVQKLTKLKEEVFVQESKVAQIPLKTGSFVRLRSGSAIGEVLNIRGNMAEVQMGMLTLSVPVIDLEVTKEPIQTNARKSVETSGVSKVPFDTRIDLREYTKQDALRMLQEFLDRALLHHAYELRIIHGYGTGVMKKEVWRMLREYKDIKKYWHPEPEAGGEGVTIVQF